MRGSEGGLRGKAGSNKPAAVGRAGYVSFEYRPEYETSRARYKIWGECLQIKGAEYRWVLLPRYILRTLLVLYRGQ